MRHGVRQLLTACATAFSVALASFGVAGAAQAATTIGTVVVVVTDSVGAPLIKADVEVSKDGGITWLAAGANGGGVFQRKVPTGAYQVRITSPGGLVDYVPGQPTLAGAATYPVVADQTTTVTEQLSQSGNVQISVVDRVTGAPVSDGCVSITGVAYDSLMCNHADGRYLFIAVPLGAQSVNVFDTTTHWAAASVPITVGPGFGDYPVRLDPAAAIRTVVQAADDPSQHPQFCVQPVYPAVSLINGSQGASCSDPATGDLTIGPLVTAPVQLFAVPAELFDSSKPFLPTYGAQWIGVTGGTGDQRLARTVGAVAGTVTTIPTVRVDHAGSISGVVSNPYGDTLSDLWIRPFAPQLNLGLTFGTGLAVIGGVSSSFTLTGLGPYAWPVDFLDYSRGVYAEQWSGGATNRYGATLVQVQAGQTSTVRATMAYASGVSGSFYAAPRTPSGASNTWVMATNAVTGDWTGSLYMYGNAFSVSGLNSDPVRLTYLPGDGHTYHFPFAVAPSGIHSTGIVLSPTTSQLAAPGPFTPYGTRPTTPTVAQARPASPPMAGSPSYPAEPVAVAPRHLCSHTRPSCV